MEPADGLSSPERRLISVDLPAPFGPITAWISPTYTSSETSATARSPPKRFSNPSARSATSGMAGLPSGNSRLARAPRNPKRMRLEDYREELAHALREGEHEADDDEALDELPMFRRGAQHLFEAHQDGGAEERAGDRPHAAEDHHGERGRRHVPAEHLRRHIAELGRREIAGDAGERAGHREGGKPDAVDRESERARPALVDARRRERMAEGRAHDHGEERDAGEREAEHNPVERRGLFQIEEPQSPD